MSMGAEITSIDGNPMVLSDVESEGDSAVERDAQSAVVVVGVDDSPASLHALRQAATIVKAVGGRIVIVFSRQMPLIASEIASATAFVEIDSANDEIEHASEADALAVCSSAGVPATFVRCDGDPGRSIIDVAHDVDASCVVVGATIHGAISSLVFSSVAEYLLHHCDLSLVIVRPASAEGSEMG